jgi:hypothetical protein
MLWCDVAKRICHVYAAWDFRGIKPEGCDRRKVFLSAYHCCASRAPQVFVADCMEGGTREEDAIATRIREASTDPAAVQSDLCSLKLYLARGDGERPERYRRAAERLEEAARAAALLLHRVGPGGDLARVLHCDDPAFAALSAVQQTGTLVANALQGCGRNMREYFQRPSTTGAASAASCRNKVDAAITAAHHAEGTEVRLRFVSCP